MRVGTATAIATAMAADACALVLTTPAARQLPAHLRRADQWLARSGADGAALGLAAAALWLVALWVAVALLCAVAATAPGGLGSAGQAVARRIMPRAVRIVVLSSIGVAVAGTPTLAQASSTGSSAGHGVGVGVGASGGFTGVGGSTAGVTAPATLASLRRAGEVAVGWPHTDASPSGPRIGWPGTSTAPPTPPTPPSQRTTATHPAAQRRGDPGTGRPVTVAPGESLWLIAAHRLGRGATQAEIADAWPQWYAANRAVIGTDPNHIEPRQQLSTPPDAVSDQKGASR